MVRRQGSEVTLQWKSMTVWEVAKVQQLAPSSGDASCFLWKFFFWNNREKNSFHPFAALSSYQMKKVFQRCCLLWVKCSVSPLDDADFCRVSLKVSKMSPDNNNIGSWDLFVAKKRTFLFGEIGCIPKEFCWLHRKRMTFYAKVIVEPP